MQYHDFNASQNHQIIKNIFKNISEDEIQYLLNHSHVKKYQKNDTIIQNNHPAQYHVDALYILLDGIIQIGYLSPSGRFHAFNYYSEKNFINLFSCLQSHRPEYDYYAFNQVRTLVIPKQIFLALIERNALLSKEVMSLLAFRMHHLMAELKFLHIANLSQKIAKILINLTQHYGVRHALGTEIKLKVSQHDLADLLSASRQTINKEIKKLSALNVLTWQYENIIIQDLEYLNLQINSL